MAFQVFIQFVMNILTSEVIWAAVIASGLTFLGVYLSNREHRICIKMQLDHATQEKRKEREFQLYADFWKLLINFRDSASVTPMLDMMPVDKEAIDVYKERWMVAAQKFDEVHGFFKTNKPFFYNEISVTSTKLLAECKKHLIKLKITLQNDRRVGKLDVYQEDENASEMINDAIEKIEIVIKNRIGML